jgi:hypothetical protein
MDPRSKAAEVTECKREWARTLPYEPIPYSVAAPSKYCAWLVGYKFGRLSVIAFVRRASHKQTSRWLCRCECGRTTEVSGTNLVSLHVASCGCSRKRPLSLVPPKRERQRLPAGESAFRSAIGSYKSNAIARGVQFLLSVAETRRLFSLNCHYCGAPPSNVVQKSTGDFVHSGIDRVDSSKDYTPDKFV